MNGNLTVNLDLLLAGIAVAGSGILGFSIFFSNRHSITNRSFAYFSIVTIIWSVINYLAYGINDPQTSFWLFRFVIAIATWHAFFFFMLAYVFPDENITLPNLFNIVLLPLVFLISILDLTPLVFRSIKSISSEGKVLSIENGPAIAIFSLAIAFLIVGGIVLFIWKTIKAKKGLERRQFVFTLTGVFATFLLIMVFNFILPAFFDNPRFISLSGIFIFPFLAFTAYAIFKHHLLNVKVIATEILTFVLAVVTLFEVVLAKNTLEIAFRFGIFILVLGFGILLIRSVLREVEQREELQRLNKQLGEAKVKLEDLNRFKTQLLSIASHQFKSPLAAIKGFVSLILEGSYGETTDKVKETLVRVKRSADGLINLVNSILDLRKVEEGKMDYQFKKTDIVKLVKDVVEGLRSLAIEKKLDLSFSSAQNEIFVNADEEKLKQVIQNITDNAIKYTPTGSTSSPQGGFVKVEIQDVGNEVIISVTDSGLGISPILLPHVFEEFTRDDRVKKEIRGTGIGLYIVQKITEAHGGQIRAESAGENKGSKFVVTLKKVS